MKKSDDMIDVYDLNALSFFWIIFFVIFLYIILYIIYFKYLFIFFILLMFPIICILVLFLFAFAIYICNEILVWCKRKRKYVDGNIIIFIFMIIFEGIIVFSIPKTLGKVENKKEVLDNIVSSGVFVFFCSFGYFILLQILSSFVHYLNLNCGFKGKIVYKRKSFEWIDALLKKVISGSFLTSIIIFLLSNVMTPTQLSVVSVLLNINICLFVDSVCFFFFYSPEMRDTIPVKIQGSDCFFTLFQSKK